MSAATSLPARMQAIQIHKTGGVDVLEHSTSVPLPTPEEGEILVKNEYIGVNYIDTYFRTGLYPAPHFPYTLGREGGGTIQSLGPGSHPPSLQQGTKVAYLAQGSYAQFTAVSTTHCIALPEKVDTKVGAAALLQGLTALTLIREAYRVQKDDWILVHAAAGGMGLWLCQLLRAVGAKTIGTASAAEKRELATHNGAEVVLEYPENIKGGAEAFVKRVKELTDGEGVKAVFDGVGKATFDVSLDCVARKGTLASFGNASGAVPPFAIARLSAKNVKLMRPTLFNFVATREEFETYADELMGMVDRGEVKVKVHKVYELENVKSAHEDIEGRGTTGKLLLKP